MRSIRLISFFTFLTVVLISAAAAMPQPGLLRAAVATEEEEEHGQEEKEKAGLKEALLSRRAPPRPVPPRAHLALTSHGRVHALSTPASLDRLPPGRRPPLRLLI